MENLSATLMDAQETPEAWVAYAFLAKCQKRHDKALYFTEKVFFYFGEKNIEGSSLCSEFDSVLQDLNISLGV